MTNKEAARMIGSIGVDEYGELYAGSWYHGIQKDYETAFDRAVKALEQVSKTGHWEQDIAFQGGIKETWYRCSECGFRNALVIPRNYCPNCGAKMEVGE